MSAYVLLNFSNELVKGIKCEACRAFYLFFRNEFDKFNNTGARMLYSICHMTLELFCNRIFGVKKRQYFAIFYTTLQWTSLS